MPTVFLGFLQFAPVSIFFLILGKASDFTEDHLTDILNAVVWIGIIVALSAGFLLYLVLSPRRRKMWYLGLPLLLALPLTASLVAGAPGLVPMSIAHTTKIGNFRANSLTFSSKACPLMRTYTDLDCAELGDKSFQMCNIHVMSRLGGETYLRVASVETDSAGKHAVTAVILPTAFIEGWDIDFGIKALRTSAIQQRMEAASSKCIERSLTLQADSTFGFNGFVLTAEGEKQIRPIVGAIRASADRILQVRIIGHADRIGTEPYNTWLARRRAEEVRLHLLRQLNGSVRLPEIVADGRGAAEPVISMCPEKLNRIQCEAPNRRVNIEIVPRSPDAP